MFSIVLPADIIIRGKGVFKRLKAGEKHLQGNCFLWAYLIAWMVFRNFIWQFLSYLMALFLYGFLLLSISLLLHTLLLLWTVRIVFDSHIKILVNRRSVLTKMFNGFFQSFTLTTKTISACHLSLTWMAYFIMVIQISMAIFGKQRW